MQRISTLTWVAYGVCGLVGIVVVVGLLVSGTPGSERARKRDDQRTNDLKQIQAAVESYYYTNKELPDDIGAMYKQQYATAPQDPKSGQSYTYEKRTDNDYRVCAVFETQGDQNGPDYYGMNWDHGIGRSCYDRHVSANPAIDLSVPNAPYDFAR